MSGAVQRVKVRLFVEGVEIPCISATVQSAPNSPLVCSLQVLPLAEGTRFLPRSIVHLFFVDEFEVEVPNLRTTAKGRKVASTTFEKVKEREGTEPELEITDSDVNDHRLQHYKLLFVGEIMGFAWSKSPRSRSLVLQCSDLSNYWDYAYQHNNTDLFGPGYKALFSGGSTNLFTDFLSSPGEIASKILQTPSTRYPQLKGLLGGIVHLLEAIGGSYYYDKKYAGQNLFFSIAELRLHITQMITAYDKDPTSSALMGGGYDALFGRSLGSLGDQVSFRTVVNKLVSFIFHETYAQPCPKFSPGTGSTVSGFTRKKVLDYPEMAGAIALSEGILQLVRATLELLDSDKAAAGKQAAQLRIAKNSCERVSRAVRAVKGPVASVAKQVASALATASNQLGVAANSLNPSTYEEARQQPMQRQGDNTPVDTTPVTGTTPANYGAVRTALEKVISVLAPLKRLEVNTNTSKEAIPASLKQQIFRPDVWFSAPPRCNVLFPDHYLQLNFNRSFMAEPTRLMLKTHDEFFGEDELFDNFYFAPKALTVKAEANTLRNILQNDVMDHELFTGILPVFEKMGEFNIFAAKSGVVNGKVGKVGAAQRATNFLYFKYRFAARQMQVACRFIPYIACGFPGLVIDKYVDLDAIKGYGQSRGTTADSQGYASGLSPLLGTHFLGNFTEVTHQLDQRTGTTSINCSYARQVDETTEFLGAQQETMTKVIKQQDEKSLRSSVAAAIYPPRVGSMGPGRGRIVAVEDVTSDYAMLDGKGSTQSLPLLGADRDKKTKQLTLKVPVGIRQLASAYGAAVAEYVGDQFILVEFRAFRVSETKQIETSETVFLPPEEYIRPNWYGACWAPSNISEVYYDFFDTGSITEATQVQNSDGDEAGGVYGTNDATAILNHISETGEDIKLAANQILSLSQTKEATIAQSVALLVLSYSVVRHGKFDTDAFIRSYTWRPIATLLDMFGSNDLTLSEDGLDVVQGIEGFHSRAFGPFDNLFGLVPPEVNEILGLKEGSTASHRADTRKRKRAAVLEYAATLKLGRVLLG